MVMGLGLGLWDNQRRFNLVASLLPGASVLAIYDPSDMATLFQDRAGTVPVTAAGQLVGQIRDKGPGGFHRTAMTDAARATYARHPASGIRNIANGSADVSNNAVWVASETNNGVTITKTATGSDANGPWVEYSVVGTASAVSLCNPYVSSSYSRTLAASGQTWTTSFRARIVSGTPLPPACGVRADITGETAPATFTESSTGAIYQSSTEGIASISRTLSAGATNQVRGGINIRTDTGATVNYVVRIQALQVEQGASRTAYQTNMSVADITEEGQPSVWSLLYTGSHAYSTATITPGVDKAQVFAGVRKQSDAALGALFEIGAGGANGTFGLSAPAGASATYRAFSQGTVFQSAVSPTTFASPTVDVLTGLADISGDLVTLRIDGVQSAQATGDQGTGNYGPAALFFGGRSGTSLFFTGREYGTIVRFSSANLDAGLIARTERSWVAPRTGVVI